MPNLVGIGNSQVPTNAMLGGLAYQDSVGEINIEKIKARTSDTALNIFVYDTRKDSDGGAWRKRATTQSWYNEVVSAERGARREFPSVAVIVVASTVITIYDGDDPNLPMWMVLKEGGSSKMLYSSSGSDFSGAVSALNGNIYYGMTGNGTLGIIEFVRDSAFKHRNNNRTNRGRWRGTIADRNLGLGWFTENDIRLAGEAVSDIATTVLPNAPIETSTGLPVPTIAAATEGGTSIIKDDGTIVDIVYSGSPNTAYVDFRKSDNAIVMSMNSNGSYVHVIYDIPSSDISGSQNYQKEGIDNEFYRTGSSQDWNQDVWIYAASPFGGDTVRIVNNVISGNGGINVLSPSRTAPATDTMVARITSSFNSGYMHGDIQGAFLSDTDDTNVTGSELITNPGPNFSDTSGWGATNGSLSVSSGDLLLTGANNVNEHMYSTGFTLTSGKTYVLSVDSNQIFTYCRIGSSTALSTSEQLDETVSSGLNSFTFTASATGTYYLKLGMVTSYVTGSINSVSLRLAELDRSKSNKGIQVFGTVTKSAVATGAELVAYGGFSGSNFLRQPPNSNMNIGTGDAYEMIWFKTTNSSDTMMLISYEGGANGTTDYGKPFNIRYESGVVRGWASHNSFSAFDDVSHGKSTANGSWHCAAWVKRGAIFELYVNGEFIGSDTGAVGSNALSDANSELVIGARKRGKSPTQTHEESFDGYLALARIGKTAPSAEKIKKIYEDEKHLFNEGAKSTLHGTSDAVTALAFDDTNDVLYVGTSSGRSEFQGLNRINNTTTAVTTAISASNEFVAEQ